MKNVYSNPVSPYGKNLKERILDASARLNTRVSQLRGSVTVILAISFILNAFSVKAQNCPVSGTTVLNSNENTYYPGTASVAAGGTSITLGAIGSGANFGNTPIAIGDIVLVIQMQGATIKVPAVGSALYGGNISGYGAGNLSTGLEAGKMEFAIATNAVPVGGGSLTITAGLTNPYTSSAFGANGKYTFQVIRVSTHYNIQLGATINTPLWNGSTGGVIVISAVNQLDFNSKNISAVGAGFRGGGTLSYNGAPGTLKTDYYTTASQNANGGKAEGIAGTPRYVLFNGALVDNIVEGYPSGSRARGAPGNAGGGATDSDPTVNDQNAGGGGGGNGGAGGLGGNGWFSFGFSGGKGGGSFTTFSPAIATDYAPNRLIMGGGGGGGSSNNGTGTPGGGVASSGNSGGGLVVINANTIIGTGTIDASGAAPNNTVQIDGSGGGGAGGSILIYANSGQIGITAIANGADGSSNFPAGLSATQHGPGGGGGGGVIYSNNPLNISSSVLYGMAGISHGTSAVDSFNASRGFIGVLTQTFPFSQLPPNMQICQTSVLPVTILSFSAGYVSTNNVKVAWSTTNEINASYFVVERSSNGADFIDVAQENASESINPIHNYSINDQLYNVNSNVVYYRLRIVDTDGKYAYSKIIPVKLDQPESSISVYPNPVDNYTIVNLYSDKPGTGLLRLIDDAGRQMMTKSFTVINGNNSLMVDQLGHLPKGIYVIQLMVNNNLYNQKIVKK
jgi:hypothetical protein